MSQMKNLKYIFWGAVILFLVFSGASGFAANQSAAADDKREMVVNISNFSFNPAEITISPGTKVTWVNQDGVGHNAAFNNTKGPILKKGEKWSMIFDKAGTYSYICSPHPFMKGTVIVK